MQLPLRQRSQPLAGAQQQLAILERMDSSSPPPAHASIAQPMIEGIQQATAAVICAHLFIIQSSYLITWFLCFDRRVKIAFLGVV